MRPLILPRTPRLTEQYSDALHVLTVAARRPASVVNIGGEYSIRVDFEFARYLLATNTTAGLYDSDGTMSYGDEDSPVPWRVQVIATANGSDQVIADTTAPWLIDAYDAAHALLKDLQPPLLPDDVPAA